MPSDVFKVKVVRWVDPKTQRRVKPNTPGAEKIEEESRKYYAKGIPGYPPRKAVPLASDKLAARAMLTELVRRGERGEQGLAGEEIDQQKRPLTEHLKDFKLHLEAKDITPEQVDLTLQRCAAILDGCRLVYGRDITADKVQKYLAGRRRLKKQVGGISAQSSNYYLGAFKHFCRWLYRSRPQRIPQNPLEGAEGVNAEVDRRHLRRELSAPELVKIFDAARTSTKTFRGLTGNDRYHLYLTAAGTGFRVSELASLEPESFNLNADPPAVLLGAREQKNRKKGVRQPIPRSVANALRTYLQDREPGKPIWPGTWVEKGAKMLGIDLAKAGVPYVVEGPDGPLHADFHSLRHSYITALAKAGLSPKEAQVLARHSTVTLTLGLYTHSDREALHEGVERLALPGPDHQAATLGEAIAALPRADVNALALAGLVALGVLQMLLGVEVKEDTGEKVAGG